MWWRLSILGAVTGALLLILFVPIPGSSVTIKLDYPPGTQPPSSAQVQTSVERTVWVTEAAIVAVIVGVSGWIAWRIIRRYRISN